VSTALITTSRGRLARVAGPLPPAERGGGDEGGAGADADAVAGYRIEERGCPDREPVVEPPGDADEDHLLWALGRESCAVRAAAATIPKPHSSTASSAGRSAAKRGARRRCSISEGMRIRCRGMGDWASGYGAAGNSGDCSRRLDIGRAGGEPTSGPDPSLNSKTAMPTIRLLVAVGAARPSWSTATPDQPNQRSPSNEASRFEVLTGSRPPVHAGPSRFSAVP